MKNLTDWKFMAAAAVAAAVTVAVLNRNDTTKKLLNGN